MNATINVFVCVFYCYARQFVSFVAAFRSLPLALVGVVVVVAAISGFRIIQFNV